MKKEIIRILLLTTILFPVELSAQAQNTINFKDSIPLSSKIIHGTLDNGFTYYIYKDMELMDNKVFMRFVVNTGYFDQEKNQSQIAHAIEHIAFMGNKDFPGVNKNQEKLSNVGMLASDIGGRTSGTYTRYSFNYPVTRPLALENGLLWFRNIAGNLKFTLRNVQRSKKEIFGEYSLSSPIGLVKSKYLPKLHGAFRSLKSGSPLKYMKAYTLEIYQAVYKNWYRPNNMALLVVGKIGMDEDEIISMIKTRFSDLKNPKIYKKRIDYDQEFLNRNNQLISVVENELGDQRILLSLRRSKFYLKSLMDYNELMHQKVLIKMIGNRVGSINQRYNAPTTMSHFKQVSYPPTFVIELRTKVNDSIRPAIQAAVAELKRIQQHGFSENELESAKREIKNNILNVEQRNAKTMINELERHFTTGEAFFQDKYNMMEQLVTSIRLKDIEHLFSKLVTPETPMDVILMSPNNNYSITRNMIFGWIDQAWKKIMKSYSGVVAPTVVMEPEQVQQLEEKNYQITKNGEYGITELILENGAKVILKPIKQAGPSNSNKIVLQGFSAGGASFYDSKDYFSAINAAQIIQHSGAGGFNLFELNEYISDKVMEIMPYIDHNEKGVKGMCDEKNFESLMQLTFLYLTQPNKDKLAFDDWLSSKKSFLSNQNSTHAFIQDSIANVLGNTDHYNIQSRIKGLDKTDFNTAYTIYKNAFANAGNFVFVIAGNFETDKIIPIVNEYLGALPDNGKRNPLSFTKKHFSHAPGKYTIFTDSDRAEVNLCFAGSNSYDIYEQVNLNIIQCLLRPILIKRLRYKEAGVYSATSFFNQHRFPDWYDFNISFRCDKNDMERLISATWEEIETLKNNGIERKDFDIAINKVKRSLLYSTKTLNMKMVSLVEHYRGKENLDDFAKQKIYLDKISPKDIQNAIINYLKKENCFQFVGLPENIQSSK